MNYEIGYDEKKKRHFVYRTTGLRPIVFCGSYTQCLVVIGGVSLGDTLETAITHAKKLYEKK